MRYVTPNHVADRESAEVVAREVELLRAECRADGDRLRDLLHPDFREHGASGTVWTFEGIIADLVASPGQPGEPVDLQAHRLAEDVVLVTYRIEGRRPSLRSSVWLRDAEGRWQIRFHQGTLLSPG